MPHTPVDKRNFYLALSIIEGQKIASSAGFSVPSPEVQESEIMDTISKWVVLAGLGVFETIQVCADWMMEVVRINTDLDEPSIENTKNVMLSFGMALISHMIDNDLLYLPESDDQKATTGGVNIFDIVTFVISDEDDEEDEEEEDDDYE